MKAKKASLIIKKKKIVPKKLNSKTIKISKDYSFSLGKSKITLFGVKNANENSFEEIRKKIEDEKPDTICLEISESRMNAVLKQEHWENLDIFQVFKNKQMYVLLSSLIFSSFQKKMGEGKIRPGDEMKIAIELAQKKKISIFPVDRELQITLRRLWKKVSLYSKLFVFSALITSLFVKEEMTPEKIKELKTDDVLKDLFSQLPSKYHLVKEIIIDERDQYIAQMIRESSKNGKKVLAIVGEGHLEGIKKFIIQDYNIAELDVVPTRTIRETINYFFSPLFFIILIGSIFFFMGKNEGEDFVIKWILIKGSLAALGALIALAHPLSIILAFVSAPIGTFVPIVKAGWVAALTESWLKKPKVKDFEQIAQDSTHWKGYWKNNVIRIFLVFTLPQIGSSIGTIILTSEGFSKIFKFLF